MSIRIRKLIGTVLLFVLAITWALLAMALAQSALTNVSYWTALLYYVIAGRGTMVLDDQEIELHEGVVVYVPRGVKHKARGDLTVLTVCVPRGVLGDVHELE